MIMRSKTYEELADLYAENYGIIDYFVEDHIMTYTEDYPREGYRYVAYVDLNTYTEHRKESAKI